MPDLRHTMIASRQSWRNVWSSGITPSESMRCRMSKKCCHKPRTVPPDVADCPLTTSRLIHACGVCVQETRRDHQHPRAVFSPHIASQLSASAGVSRQRRGHWSASRCAWPAQRPGGGMREGAWRRHGEGATFVAPATRGTSACGPGLPRLAPPWRRVACHLLSQGEPRMALPRVRGNLLRSKPAEPTRRAGIGCALS